MPISIIYFRNEVDNNLTVQYNSFIINVCRKKKLQNNYI